MKPSRGRPKCIESVRKIYMKDGTFQLWNEKKREHKVCRNYEFVALLLSNLPGNKINAETQTETGLWRDMGQESMQ